jgi:3-oxoacyl-[acyl-carrier protein] reductase
MTSPLLGKTALITGGGAGLGRAIALELASAGARIAVTFQTHKPDQEFTETVSRLTGEAPLVIPLEATSESETIGVVEAIRSSLGGVNILVNNVGGLVQRASIAEMEFSLWRRVLAVNLDSMFLMTHHIMSTFEKDGGRIINLASLAGRNGGHAGATAYATTKSAVFGFTRGLAKELAPDGTTVNAIAPGFIEATPFHDTFTTADSKLTTIAGIPAGRAGAPADVANAALWLASPGASFVNGTIIDINGAQYFG